MSNESPAPDKYRDLNYPTNSDQIINDITINIYLPESTTEGIQENLRSQARREEARQYKDKVAGWCQRADPWKHLHQLQ